MPANNREQLRAWKALAGVSASLPEEDDKASVMIIFLFIYCDYYFLHKIQECGSVGSGPVSNRSTQISGRGLLRTEHN